MCLAIVPASSARPDPNAILEHLAVAGLSRYDMPEFMLFLTEMPLTASGKIIKRELARWVAEGRVRPQPLRYKPPEAAQGLG